MMEGCGEMRRNVDRSTATDSFTSRCEDRAAAIRFVADKVLNERRREVQQQQEEEEEEEDLCSNILSSFINSLEERQWESIRERMREPLTPAHLAQVSRRIIGVVTELVYQVLVPVLMAELQDQDSSDASSKKSHKEEDIQSGDSRSSLVMVKPYDEGSLGRSPGGSASQSSARSMLGGAAQQVEQDLSLLAVPPIESPVDEIPPWHDVEQRQEPATVITETMDSCEERTEEDVETERDACKILKTEINTEYESDLDSLDGECCCWCPSFSLRGDRGDFSFSPKTKTPQQEETTVREGSPLQDTVRDEDVSGSPLGGDSLAEPESLSMKPLSTFSPPRLQMMFTFSAPSEDAVTSGVMDTVVNCVNQLFQMEPGKITFPLEWFKNTTKSGDGECTTSLGLNVNVMELLLSHKDALDKRKEDEEKRTLSHLLSGGSEERAEDSTAAGSCESSVSSMRSAVKSFLDETEQMLEEDDSSVRPGDAAVTRLEELISQEKMFTLCQLLAHKVSDMFKEQLLAVSEPSEPSQSQQGACPAGGITPTEQVYVFVEEAVKRLLMSLFCPASPWGMGHKIQVQSGASSHANVADSAEWYEDVIGVYSGLMADQVIENLSRTSAASRPQQEVTGPKRKENCIRFFQELPNNIRRKWRKLRNKDV